VTEHRATAKGTTMPRISTNDAALSTRWPRAACVAVAVAVMVAARGWRRLPGAGAVVLPLAAALVLAVGLAAPPGRVAAQAGAQLEILLHTGFVGVRTESSERPTVRLFTPEGGLKIAVTPSGPRPADGHWIIDLLPGGAGEGPPILVRPGDTVELSLGSSKTALVVPEMTASADVEAGVVRGRAPGAGPVVALLHRDPRLFGATADPEPAVGLAGADGRFEVAAPGDFGMLPGTWGELAYVSPAGHVFAAPFSPPFATVLTGSHIAVVRADGGAEPTLAVLDRHGVELSRAGRAIEYGGGIFVVLLARGGDIDSGLFLPEPGEQLALIVDGAMAASESVTWRSATLDPGSSQVRGRAAPGSRVHVESRVSPTGTDMGPSLVVTATADGRWSVELPAEVVPGIDDETQVEALLWAGGSFAHVVVGRVPYIGALLYGNRVSGVLEGRGEAVITHFRSGDEGIGARAFADIEPDGAFEANLYSGGEEIMLFPGDRISVATESEQGSDPVAVVVPAITANPEDGGAVLAGAAMPGAAVRAEVYPQEPNIFGVDVFELDHFTLSGRAGPEGSWALECAGAGPDGRARYGTAFARKAGVAAEIHWIDAPVFGVSVTRSNAQGKATAGSRVRVTGDGLEAPLSTVSRPQPQGRLPGWEASLWSAFPSGLPEGGVFDIDVDGLARRLVVPAFEWSADTATNTVSGNTSEGLRLIVVLALPPGGDGREPALAEALSGPGGGWTARFGGFDLMPGDDIEMYMLQDGYYLQWHELGIDGDEPVPTSTPPPTAAPTGTVPPPTPTPDPGTDPGMAGRSAYLPLAWR